MPASVFDSAYLHKFFGDKDVGALFTDSAELRAMLVVEGALAKAQASVGMIPEDAAEAINKDALSVTIDPAGLADATATNGVPVPALVAAFRKEMHNADAAQYVHWGATTQDIMDTGLVLRLRRVIAIYEDRLTAAITTLADLADAHRAVPMAARTWGVVATPTSVGAVIAGWGAPLIRHLERLRALKSDLLVVSLSGAAGTLSVMEPEGTEIRARLAEGLGLGDPGASWHSTRDSLAAFAAWMAGVTGSLSKMGEDVQNMVRAGDVVLTGGGSSSTMPQKQNPVSVALMTALARQMVGLSANMTAALQHRDQRDGAAWIVEWMTLPQMCIGTGKAVSLCAQIAGRIEPQPDALRAAVDDGLGLIYAEALSFHMAGQMPRPEAQAAVKELCLQANALKTPLAKLAAREWPDVDFGALFTPEAQLGDAPSEADRFVAAARAL
jgi:3-carboxy-cis,cis-muconate cycloisomerase